jgi:hypothetical protein
MRLNWLACMVTVNSPSTLRASVRLDTRTLLKIECSDVAVHVTDLQ